MLLHANNNIIAALGTSKDPSKTNAFITKNSLDIFTRLFSRDVVYKEPTLSVLSISTDGTVWGSILAPNGKIYFMPYGSSYILEFDPDTKEYELIGTFEENNSIYAFSTLHKNGKIYGTPRETKRTVLEFNYIDKTYKEIFNLPGPYTEGGVNPIWIGARLVYDDIYSPPYTANSILKLSPEKNTFLELGNIVTTSNDWYDSVLGSNKRLYCVPRVGNIILEINIEDDSIKQIEISSEFGITRYNWYNGCVAQNGKIFFTPGAGVSPSHVLIIDTHTSPSDPGVCIDPHINRT